MAHQIVSGVAPHSRDFADMLAIYAAALPVREQKTPAALAAMVQHPQYRVLICRDGREVIGFATVFAAELEPIALLEYLAIRHDRRSEGLGAALFDASTAAAAGRPLLIEIDSPAEASPDQQIRVRRKRFYERLRCRTVAGLDYVLPLPGEGPPPRMELLLAWDRGVDTIDREQLRQWLAALYVEVYAQSRHDPRIDAMVQQLAPRVALR